MMRSWTSPAAKPSPAFKIAPRRKGEDNLDWILRQPGAPPSATVVLLLGGTDPGSFRLRVAQSHIRHDLTPSSWSHAALLASPIPKSLGQARLHEIRLDPRQGFGFAPPHNGIQTGRLADYASAEAYPNVAILYLPVAAALVEKQVDLLRRQRSLLDCVELIVRWLAFVWGVGATSNPLFEACGMPSAAMLESAVNATGFDLTPGLASRASCPEAIWQAAKWWYSYQGEGAPPDSPDKARAVAIRGSWWVGQRLSR